MNKLIIIALLLIPTGLYASNNHHSGHPGKPSSPSVIPPPQNPVVPSVPSATPTAPQQNGGGGGLVVCSGPLSPGWRIDLPNGGCAPTTTPVIVHLNQIPYTGLSFWDWVMQLFGLH